MEKQKNQNDLLRSVINATKTYAGGDPLRPWLRGIKTLKQNLQLDVQKQKLPRFIEKCAMTFISDERYKNDVRYLQIWIQLLEFVPNRGEVFRTMEENNIGQRHSLFYQAYALHYEKSKKYPEAESIYKLGIQRFAQPMDILQQSYDGFLHRMAARNRRKLKIMQERTFENSDLVNKGNHLWVLPKECSKDLSDEVICKREAIVDNEVEHSSRMGSSSIQLTSENAGKMVSSVALKSGKLQTQRYTGSITEKNISERNVFDRKIDDLADLGEILQSSDQSSQYSISELIPDTKKDTAEMDKMFNREVHTDQFVRSGSYNECKPSKTEKDDNEKVMGINDERYVHAIVGHDDSHQSKLGEDTTFIQMFVDSAIANCNKDLEDARHHGLVEPTINTKEAMIDINDMFGKPLHFENPRKWDQCPKQTKKAFEQFHVLADNESEAHCVGQCLQVKNHLRNSKILSELQVFADENIGCISKEPILDPTSTRTKVCADDTVVIRKIVDCTIDSSSRQVEALCHYGLVEPTMTTKEAMQDINNMFLEPLQFKKSKHKAKSVNQSANCKVFSDENLNGLHAAANSAPTTMKTVNTLPSKGFNIFVDDELQDEFDVNQLKREHCLKQEAEHHEGLEEHSKQNVKVGETLQIFIDDDI